MIERLALHDRTIAAVALALVVALAWAWLAANGLSHDMAGMEARGPMAPPSVWSPGWLGAAFAMWALMMVAMMLPSAAPMILIYARLPGAGAPRPGLRLTTAFALAYVAVWTAFSAAAAVAQAVLISSGLVDAAALAVGDARLAGLLLVLAGLYQLTPLKEACLGQCRAPVAFIMRHARPGGAGALRLGLIHGLYCLGCCWALMLLLFVGGVMNLAWVAMIAVVVLVEKLAPPRFRARTLLGLLLLAGGATLIAGIG
jgi:predicted metal-binding membrane protein